MSQRPRTPRAKQSGALHRTRASQLPVGTERISDPVLAVHTIGSAMASAGAGSGATQLFELRHPGSCTGMFWRGNPTTGAGAAGRDWPRNGSLLRGKVHKKIKGDDWLEVSEWQQAGTKGFVSGEGKNLWMPFSQGGTLLHEIKG